MGLAPMTGSVMKATRGTEPTMEGAVGSRRNHSGGVGLSQARLVLVWEAAEQPAGELGGALLLAMWR
jgi:hypothetical protein